MTQMNEEQRALVKAISRKCETPAVVTSLLKTLFAGTIEQMLQAELDEHLGYEKHSVEGDHSGNSRNGYGKKTIKSEWGEAEIDVPRDRNGSFEPKVIEKRQTRTDDIEGRIMLRTQPTSPSVDALEAICRYFKLTPHDFLNMEYEGTKSAEFIYRRLDEIIDSEDVPIILEYVMSLNADSIKSFAKTLTEFKSHNHE